MYCFFVFSSLYTVGQNKRGHRSFLLHNYKYLPPAESIWLIFGTNVRALKIIIIIIIISLIRQLTKRNRDNQ